METTGKEKKKTNKEDVSTKEKREDKNYPTPKMILPTIGKNLQEEISQQNPQGEKELPSGN